MVDILRRGPNKAIEAATRTLDASVAQAMAANPIDGNGVLNAVSSYETNLFGVKGLKREKALDTLSTRALSLAELLRERDAQTSDTLTRWSATYRTMIDKMVESPSRELAESTPAPMDQGKL